MKKYFYYTYDKLKNANTVVNFLKYTFGKKNSQKSYVRMRYDYVHSDLIDKTVALNGRLHPKYKLNVSEGILGKLNSSDVENVMEQIRNKGFYIFDQKIPDTLLNEMREVALNTPVNYLEVNGDAIKYSNELVNYSESQNMSNRFQFIDTSSIVSNEKISNLVQDENLLHLANEYLGCRPVIDLVAMWWSRSLEKINISDNDKDVLKSAAAQMFHFDLDRMKFLRFFVYLSDVNENNGPHVFVKSTHNKKPDYINRDGRFTDEEIYEKDGDNVVEITGKAGTIIAIDTRGLHKGKELKEGERLIFQINYTNSLFGKPEMQVVSEKTPYKGNSKYFKTYNSFFKK